MSDMQQRIQMSGTLKQQLVAFGMKRRFQRQFRVMLAEVLADDPPQDEGAMMNLMDVFLLEHLLPDGKTVVQHFVEAHSELSEEEREIVLGWQDVVSGIFEVRSRQRDALVLFNLVDELTYRAYSNMGPVGLAPMRAKSFLITRLVPIGDAWLISGATHVLPKSDRSYALALAYDIASTIPDALFRNPEKLEQGWEAQRKERQAFIEYFGSDEVIVPGHDVAERFRAYLYDRIFEQRDEDGETVAQKAERRYGQAPELPESSAPPEMEQADTVGIMYDEVEGLTYLQDYGRFVETFADPQLAGETRHRAIVLGYLKDDSIPPTVFRRQAAQNVDAVNQVLRQVLKRPRFNWDHDGERLLSKYKGDVGDRNPLPSILPLPTHLVEAQLAAPRR